MNFDKFPRNTKMSLAFFFGRQKDKADGKEVAAIKTTKAVKRPAPESEPELELEEETSVKPVFKHKLDISNKDDTKRRKLRAALAESESEDEDAVMTAANKAPSPGSSDTKSNASQDTDSNKSNKTKKGSSKTKAAKKTKDKKAPKMPKKDPNEPKRPMSSFLLFGNKHRAEVKAANPDVSFGEIGKLIGQKWKVVSEEGK